MHCKAQAATSRLSSRATPLELHEALRQISDIRPEMARGRLRQQVRSRRNPECARHKDCPRPEAEGRFALPRQEFGLDVIALSGVPRHAERRGVPEIFAELLRRGVPICERSVGNLLDRHDEPLALACADPTRLRASVAAQGRAILATDGQQPDDGHEVLRGVREALSGEVLLARSLRSSTQEDLDSRRIVGRSMAERIDSRRVADALEMTVSRRAPTEGLVADPDRGSRYASEHDQRLRSGHAIDCSMSRRANCWDNAPMESFLASLKKELTRGEIFATRAEARAGLFESIEVFSNRVRRHSSLGSMSPADYERAG